MARHERIAGSLGDEVGLSPQEQSIMRMRIMDMTRKWLSEATVGDAAPAHEARNEVHDETARYESGRLDTSQHGGTTQDGKAEKCHLLQQPKPKPKPLLKLWPELRQEPKPRPTHTLAYSWATVQPRTHTQKGPSCPGLTRLSGSSIAERCFIWRTDESVPPPNIMDQ